MTIPGRPQTFALDNAWDMYTKLEWEIEGLKAAPANRSLDELAYRAFNCAVTAWQLTDWAWDSLQPPQKKMLSVESLADFQSWCRQQSRALHICRQIATASKHAVVTRYPDPNVRTSASASVSHFRVGDTAGTPLSRWKWTLRIHDDDAEYEAVEIFEQTLQFWDQFMMQHLSDARTSTPLGL